MALRDVKSGLAKHKANELQTGISGMRNDRKDRGKRSLQAFVLTFFRRNSRLQKGSERFKLSRKQERNIKHASALGEALANALLLGEGVSHGNSVKVKSNVKPVKTGKRKQALLPFGEQESIVCVCQLALIKFVFYIRKTGNAKHKKAGG
jgi:hypothetical protein